MIWRIKNFFREIKWFIQRGKRGYSDLDVWNIDMWFERVFPQMIKQLKEIKHGYPCDSTPEEFDQKLSDLIHYLTEMNEETCSKENEYEEDFNNQLWAEERNEEITDKWMNRQIEIDKYREEMKNKALNLFSELYYTLWD